jgi:signal transduction histidine kinase
VLDRGSPRYEPDGTFAGYIGSCTDITEKKRAEERLERAVRERDDFLAIASHELKTPVAALQLTSDLLRRAPEDERSPRHLENLQAQVVRLTALVDTLLEASRLATDRPELTRDNVDLASLVRDAGARFSAHASAADSPLTVAAPQRLDCGCDKSAIERVLDNLVANALKYGAGRPIEIGARGEPRSAVLWVRDHGIGIAPADQERIFGRFERAVSPRHYSGFGLGLWIARRLIDAHGGRITVTSAPGEGATFEVKLPA